MTSDDHALLTLDEAVDLVGTTAITLADHAPPHRVADLLAGQGTLRGLDADTKKAVRNYRLALQHVRAVSLDWIIDDQVEGALNYAGIDSATLAA